MSDRQVKLYSTETPGAKKINTTTISNVNPTASGATMKTYAQMLNNFTTNTYVKTDLIETTNLDTETVKTFADIEISTTGVFTTSGDQEQYRDPYVPFTVNGENFTGTIKGYATMYPVTGRIFKLNSTSSGSHPYCLTFQDTSQVIQDGSSVQITAILFENETNYTTVATQIVQLSRE